VSGGTDYVYPAWQFGADGEPIPALERILAAATSVGMDARALDSFMNRRVGTGGPKMWELARAGRDDYVISSLRSAA